MKFKLFLRINEEIEPKGQDFAKNCYKNGIKLIKIHYLS